MHHAYRLFRSLSLFFVLYGLNEGLFYLLYYIHVNTIVFFGLLAYYSPCIYILLLFAIFNDRWSMLRGGVRANH